MARHSPIDRMARAGVAMLAHGSLPQPVDTIRDAAGQFGAIPAVRNPAYQRELYE